MSHYIEDPWADPVITKSHSNDRNDGMTSNFTLTDGFATSSIFGDSTASSMMDSVIGTSDPLSYTSNNSWGGYNSSNILSNSANHSKSHTTSTAKTLDKLKTLEIGSHSTATKAPILGSGTTKSLISQANVNLEQELEREEDAEEQDEDNEINEDELFRTADVKVWSDEQIRHFNPLSIKNSVDGIAIKVREIPEKEGLVFKHINYLISHTLKFGKEYNIPRNTSKDISTQDSETKVIRRYSDFVWLVDVLWKKYPFRLIPELPPKQFASKYLHYYTVHYLFS